MGDTNLYLIVKKPKYIYKKMFQKNTYTVPSDSSGVLLARVIQTRRCSTRRHAKTGKFLRIVVKNTQLFLLKKKRKHSRAICIRTMHYYKKVDGMRFNFSDNAIIVLKKRMNCLGKELYGPTSRVLKIKKFRIAFSQVF